MLWRIWWRSLRRCTTTFRMQEWCKGSLMVTHSWEAWLIDESKGDSLSCPKRVPILSSERGFLPTFLCTCDSNRDSGFYFKTFSIGIKRLASPHHILDLHIIQIFNSCMVLKKNHATTVLRSPGSFTKNFIRLRSWGWRHENLMHLFFRAF